MKIVVKVKGGPGSGYYEHDGREGQLGGSSPGKVSLSQQGRDFFSFAYQQLAPSSS